MAMNKILIPIIVLGYFIIGLEMRANAIEYDNRIKDSIHIINAVLCHNKYTSYSELIGNRQNVPFYYRPIYKYKFLNWLFFPFLASKENNIEFGVDYTALVLPECAKNKSEIINSINDLNDIKSTFNNMYKDDENNIPKVFKELCGIVIEKRNGNVIKFDIIYVDGCCKRVQCLKENKIIVSHERINLQF
ncbi:MAG: hypothetical protein ACEB74_05405 [Desulfovibrio aminophilus]|uniref:hypothetical protein n=1 Tax=Desulfovibrio aminophilus TaxID=81425 RepID=UPI0039ECDA55